MAKKAKAKMAKIETENAKLTKVIPTYLKRGTSFKMGLHDVVRALKVIEENGQLDKFMRAAKRNKSDVNIGADSVNFVKDFMVENEMHDHPIGKHIVNARVATGGSVTAARDPFRPCSFTRGK